MRWFEHVHRRQAEQLEERIVSSTVRQLPARLAQAGGARPEPTDLPYRWDGAAWERVARFGSVWNGQPAKEGYEL